jgi:glycosyltransferase involved in cell wall biosynthesis
LSTSDEGTPRVAYLINQYPKVSHSFIRREILALEKLGLAVLRMALRGWDGDVVDAQDQQELGKTRFVLKEGAARLALQTIRTAVASPARFVAALRLAVKMMRHSEKRWFFHLIYLVEACCVLRWAREAQIQHIHAHFGTNATEVAMLAHALGGPRYSFTVHGPEEFDKPEFIGLPTKIEHSAFVVAISSFGRSQMYRWVPYRLWSKVEVVHCGLESAFHLGGNQPAVGQAGTMVCVGRLCEQKGQLLLLDALRQVVDKGIDARLVLAGDGEMREAVEQRMALLGLNDRVTITGWIDARRVRTELLAARLMVLPSFAEGLPVVVMEAMALRRPVLTTYVAGIPELVVHGRNGWLVPAGDVNRLAATMVQALAVNDTEIEVMGDDARLRVLARHSIDTEAAKLLAHFKRAKLQL